MTEKIDWDKGTITPPAGAAESIDWNKGEIKPPPKIRTWGEAARDVGAGLLQGGAGLVKTAGDAYGLATGNMNNAVSEAGKDAQEYWEDKKSDALKERSAQRKANIDAQDTTMGKAWTAIKDTVTDPALAADVVATNAATMLPGAAVGRGMAFARMGQGVKAAEAAGLTGEALTAATSAAAKSAGKFGTAGAVGTGAAQQGADVASGGYEAAMEKPDAVWDANPDFQAALAANGGDRKAAKQQIALSSARAAFVPAAAVSVAANAIPGATYLERALVGGAARDVAGAGVKYAMPKAIAKGALGEGGQEFIEEGGGQLSANAANRHFVDPSQDLMQDVGENAGLGFAGGLLMGGAGGAFHGQRAAPGSQQDQQNALNAANMASDAAVEGSPSVMEAQQWSTAPGAAPDGAPGQTQAASPLYDPRIDGMSTSPGAAQAQGNEVDFTRDFDTAGLELASDAPAGAPAAPDTATGADLGAAVDQRTPAQRLGLDENAGTMSAAAVLAVNSGASGQLQAASAATQQQDTNAQEPAAKATPAAPAAPAVDADGHSFDDARMPELAPEEFTARQRRLNQELSVAMRNNDRPALSRIGDAKRELFNGSRSTADLMADYNAAEGSREATAKHEQRGIRDELGKRGLVVERQVQNDSGEVRFTAKPITQNTQQAPEPGIYASYEDARKARGEQNARGTSVKVIPSPVEGGFILAAKGTPEYAIGEQYAEQRRKQDSAVNRQKMAESNAKYKAAADLAKHLKAEREGAQSAQAAAAPTINPVQTTGETANGIEANQAQQADPQRIAPVGDGGSIAAENAGSGARAPRIVAKGRPAPGPVDNAGSGQPAQGLIDGAATTQDPGRQAGAATAPQVAAPAADRQARAQKIASAGEQWTRMPAAERSALAGRLDGVKPVIAKNLPKSQWANLNGDLQRKIADAIAQHAEANDEKMVLNTLNGERNGAIDIQEGTIRETRDERDSGILGVATHAQTLPRSDGQELSGLRSEGIDGSGGVAEQFSGVLPRNGSSANSNAQPGSNKRDDGIRARERQVGNKGGASGESAVLPSRGIERRDGDYPESSSGTGNKTDDTTQPAAQAESTSVPSDDAGKAPLPQRLKTPDPQRSNSKSPGVGEGAGPESANSAGATSPTDAAGRGADTRIEEAANSVDVNPSAAQVKQGNYRKGHVRINGLDISIENPAGSKRRPEWPALKNHYGYLKGTVGADKDHVDVFLTDRATDPSLPVFVVDQVNRDGTFDEHKVVLGADNEADARQAYLDNYAKGWTGLGAITEMSQDDFKAWARDPAKTKVPAGKLAYVAYKAAAQEATATPAPKAPAKKTSRGVLAKVAEAQAARADYFTPGNIVKSYIGHDRVISYSPPDAEGRWSVKVQAVEKKSDGWVVMPNERVRSHFTQPSARDLADGPVLRAEPAPAVPPGQLVNAADQQQAIKAHGLPADTQFKPGKGALGSGKWIANTGSQSGALSGTVDEAAKSLADFLKMDRARAQAETQRQALAGTVAEKLKKGEKPTDAELRDLFGLAPNHTYVEQAAVGQFLVEHMGVPRNGIRKALGAAAGDRTSDGGTKYPIAYPRKLHEVFGPSVAVDPDSTPFGTRDARAGTATDRALMDMVREGKPAQDLLQLIAGTSKSRFNKQVARLLTKAKVSPTVVLEAGALGGDGNFTLLARYRRSNDTIGLTAGAQAQAEQILLHEMIHAATLKALDRKGIASLQMRKLYEHVKKQGGANGTYGMKNVGEFVAEAFTNPDFQRQLKQMSAPQGNVLKSAWDSLVRILHTILGLPSNSTSALSQALTLGVEVMREDKALRQRGAGASTRNGDVANFGTAELRGIKNKALDQINEALTHPGKVSIWDKTVGTMRHLAERNPAFKPVFDSAQQFIDDVSTLANDAAEAAPRLIPRVDSWRDLKKQPISAADNKAIAKPLFEGTLLWGRDVDGKPALVDDLAKKYANLPADDKAQLLLRAGRLDDGVLKMWRGLPVAMYEANINSRFESKMLKGGVVWSEQELKRLFGLNEHQTSLYQEARAGIDRSIDITARADMLRAVGDEFGGMRDAVMEQPTLEGARDLLADILQQESRANPNAGNRFADMNNLVITRYEKARELMDQGYAPLSRFGRYTVDVVGKDGERRYFGMFESKGEANRMAMTMKSEYPDAVIEQGTMSDQAYKMFAGITPETLEQFGNMLSLESDGDKAQDKAFQEYLKLAKNNHSALKRLIHRKGIAGYSEDVGRVLASFVYSNARMSAGGLNAGAIDKAINNIPKEQGELKDVAMGLRNYIQDPQEEGQAVRGFLFAQYLGGSVASAMVNMTQPFAVTMPWLSQYGGIKKAGAQMAKALKDMGTRGFKYEADLAKALQIAEDDGTVSPQEVHQLMAQARGAGGMRSGDGTRRGDAVAKAANAWEKTKVAWGQPFALAEQFNRRSTFIASYRIAKEQGMANPAEFARRAVIETQFLYSKANKMRWARGAVGGTLMTFKTYSVSYLELMHRMWTQGGPEGKRAVGWAVAMLLLMSGAGGLPFIEDAEDLIDGAGQMMGYNLSSKQVRKEFLSSVLGKDMAEFINSGVSGLPGSPIDLGRLGMGNLIPGTGLALNKPNRERDLLEIAGPAGDLVARTFTGARKLLSGEVGGAAMEVMPGAVRNLAKGADMAASGMYKDTKGYKVIDTSLGEALTKAIGFQPKSVAEVQEANGYMQRAKSFYVQTSSEIKAQWADALFRKDERALEAVRNRLDAWNRNNPDQRITVSMPGIWKRVHEMGKDKQQRIAGTAPRALRQQLREMVQETNR